DRLDNGALDGRSARRSLAMSDSMSTNEIRSLCDDLGRNAKTASRALAIASGAAKNRWLLESATALEAAMEAILVANQRDLARAPGFGLSDAQVDRLKLTPARVQAAATGLREIAAFPDPVGRVLDGSTRPNGLEIRKVGVPIGVLFFLYESRPNVTVDAAGLAVKSGNAIIL